MKWNRIWKEACFLFQRSMSSIYLLAFILLTLFGNLLLAFSIVMYRKKASYLYLPGIFLVLAMIGYITVAEDLLRAKGIRVWSNERELSTKAKILAANFVTGIYTCCTVFTLILCRPLLLKYQFPFTMYFVIYMIFYSVGIILSGVGGEAMVVLGAVFLIIVFGGNYTINHYDTILFQVNPVVTILLFLGLILFANVIAYGISLNCYKRDGTVKRH